MRNAARQGGRAALGSALLCAMWRTDAEHLQRAAGPPSSLLCLPKEESRFKLSTEAGWAKAECSARSCCCRTANGTGLPITASPAVQLVPPSQPELVRIEDRDMSRSVD